MWVFYRRFIKDFSTIKKPLSSLLIHGLPFFFDKKCKTAFTMLKDKLTSMPIVIAPDWELLFDFMCDASDNAIRVVLGSGRIGCFMPYIMPTKL